MVGSHLGKAEYLIHLGEAEYPVSDDDEKE